MGYSFLARKQHVSGWSRYSNHFLPWASWRVGASRELFKYLTTEVKVASSGYLASLKQRDNKVEKDDLNSFIPATITIFRAQIPCELRGGEYQRIFGVVANQSAHSMLSTLLEYKIKKIV